MQSQQTQIIEIDEAAQSGLSTQTRAPAENFQDVGKPKKETSVRNVLQTLLDRKWFIMGMTALAALATFIITLSMTPIYRAEAIIKIEPEDKKVLEFDLAASSGASKSEQYYRTQNRLLKSKKLARKVIDALELEAMLSPSSSEPVKKPFYEDALDGLKEALNPKAKADKQVPSVLNSPEAIFLSSLRVNSQGKSQLVGVTYDSTDPELSANIVNTLTQQFIQMNLDSRIDAASDAKLFIAKEMKSAKGKLREAKLKMIAFEKEHTIVSNPGDSNTLMRQQLVSLNAAYANAKQERIAVESSVPVKKAARPAVQLLPSSNSTIRALEATIKRKDAEYQRLNKAYQKELKVYKPSFPGMAEKKSKLDIVREQINLERSNIQAEKAAIASENNRRTAAANSANSAAQGTSKSSRLASARKKEAAMKAELEKAKTDSISLREQAIEYESLKEEVAASKELHDSLLKREKEVSVAGGVNNNNISVVDPAVVTYNKYKPKMANNLGISVIGALMLSSLIALLLGNADKRIKSVKDLYDVSELPVLGQVPLAKVKVKNKGAIRVIEDPSSAIAESFRALRTNLMFATPEGLPKILHITSAEPGEGKSNIAHNLASVFAQTNKQVLLIDADLRKPSLYKYLGLESSTSLAEYLQGDMLLQDAISESPIANLSVIAGKAVESTPADLLSSDKMVQMLEQVADIYDFVVIDSPPVMGLADSLVLSNRSTATLFVVASHQTNKRQLTDALNRLRMGYGNVVGFVLSKAKKLQSTSGSYEYGGEHVKG